MADLVRVRLGDIEKTVGAALAQVKELDVLDEPARKPDGTVRSATSERGRRLKKRTTVKKEAARKRAAAPEKADDSAAPKVESED